MYKYIPSLICFVRMDFLTQYRIDVRYHETSISMQKKINDSIYIKDLSKVTSI